LHINNAFFTKAKQNKIIYMSNKYAIVEIRGMEKRLDEFSVKLS
jgi:hypothetical protein